jgi:hypothetical protein
MNEKYFLLSQMLQKRLILIWLKYHLKQIVGTRTRSNRISRLIIKEALDGITVDQILKVHFLQINSIKIFFKEKPSLTEKLFLESGIEI